MGVGRYTPNHAAVMRYTGWKYKLKLRFFKSSEYINEKGDWPYHNFDYLSLVSDPLDLATKKITEILPHGRTLAAVIAIEN